MINRSITQKLLKTIRHFLVTGMIGPRQVGKTTLAKEVVKYIQKPSIYIVSARKLAILRCLVRKCQVRGLRSAEHSRSKEIDVFWQALYRFRKPKRPYKTQ